MTEDEAQEWIKGRCVSRETFARLQAYVKILLAESDQQNLIAQSTKESVWARHIVDSAQLLNFSPPPPGRGGQWIDLGSGAGLPGIVIAIMSNWHVGLVESRTRRAGFLEATVRALGLDNAWVAGGPVEKLEITSPADVISARAFAPLAKMFTIAHHLSDTKTLWVLPKGRSWQSDVDDASEIWHGKFHVEQSVTDCDSAIVVARGVRRKSRQ
ncbi:MAG: 16S rRNA (guanine(527)-N(7))-methyltransferase RsmG [Sphingobium sp.]|uniref:16S rRNA (guanine(527)-N(7))-methyltransferase RsmG n=1 Tax=Sphingobium sp. TaxID=1912891 RepID=UPI0029A96F24|nr:16S rRNA (guanine(527)-N(7))-methyltransferase RsmG [Sphingobium sp.]MDX3909234.1 16S rRNA (guanine(527)-N(7))-methyltransferase RsmG [Sphingobium sp.]